MFNYDWSVGREYSCEVNEQINDVYSFENHLKESNLTKFAFIDKYVNTVELMTDLGEELNLHALVSIDFILLLRKRMLLDHAMMHKEHEIFYSI